MRVDFSAENKTSQYTGYPKITVEKGEDARLCILESPLVVYKHTINKPVIDPTTGKVAKVEAHNSKNEPYEKDHYEYVGAYLCEGSPETIQGDPDGLDTEACALCRAVAEHPSKFKAPTQMFASHVIQYKCNPGTTAVQEPFQADLKLWILSPSKFNVIADLNTEHGDIRKTDILLTECTNKTFQNYKIGAAATGRAAWTLEDSRKTMVSQLLANNKADEKKIKETVARPATELQTKKVVDEVLERWALEGQPLAAQGGALSGEFGGQAAASQSAAAQSEDKPWEAGSATESGPDFANDAPKGDTASAAGESKGGDTISFDDLFGNTN